MGAWGGLLRVGRCVYRCPFRRLFALCPDVAHGNRSAPGVRVTLFKDEKATTGEPLDLGTRLLSFAFEDCEQKVDKLTLTLDNFDLALFDREALMAGAVLEVSWGYPDAMAPPRRVVVKSMKGFQTLTLEGQALAALMNQQAKTRRWESKSRADVVRDVAKESGYDGAFVDIEDTKEVIDVVNQTAETDARFLKRLAAREGFAFWIDGTGLHFHRRKQDAPPAHVFTWYSDERGEVLSINVESDLVKRAGSVAVKGRDPMGKTTLDSSSTADTAKRSTLGDVLEVVDPKTGTTTLLKRNATASVAPTSSSTATAAAREAEARFVKAERETVKLTMQVVGDPSLAAKSIVEVRGVSSLLSGKYYVTDAKHSISSSGYTCDLKLSRDAKGKVADGGAKPQTGDKNAAALKKAGEKKQVEMIDKATGASHVEYHDDGAGSGDPEAKPAKKGG
jgi:phage protein D